MGKSYYIAALFHHYMQFFIWNETTESFVQHGRNIEVYQARSFDVFETMMNTYLVISETYKPPHYANAAVSRVLPFNEVSRQFEYKGNFFVHAAGAIKVTTFKILGEIHAAFIFHENNGTDLSFLIFLFQSLSLYCFTLSIYQLDSSHGILFLNKL